MHKQGGSIIMYNLEEKTLNSQMSLLFLPGQVKEHLLAREKWGWAEKFPKTFWIYTVILDSIF